MVYDSKRIQRKTKVRYEKENNYYIIKINKYFVPIWAVESVFGISDEYLFNTLTKEFDSTLMLSRDNYPKYSFKTKEKAKAAVEWLKSLLTAKELIK
jgi:hypothetical protein